LNIVNASVTRELNSKVSGLSKTSFNVESTVTPVNHNYLQGNVKGKKSCDGHCIVLYIRI